MGDKGMLSLLKTNTIIDGVSLETVLEFGYCHWEEDYEDNRRIRVSIYELDSKTYLIRRVDEECVVFRDITAKVEK